MNEERVAAIVASLPADFSPDELRLLIIHLVAKQRINGALWKRGRIRACLWTLWSEFTKHHPER